jgi:hypothetical protein
MGESALLREIRLEAPKLGVTLFRNNVGMLTDQYGNKVRYGLSVGSADLIGWMQQPWYDGTGAMAVFVAIECKAPGKKPTPQQLAFLDAVRTAGGIAGVAYSLDDFRRIIAGS